MFFKICPNNLHILKWVNVLQNNRNIFMVQLHSHVELSQNLKAALGLKLLPSYGPAVHSEMD